MPTDFSINVKHNKKRNGFTLVELIIVIVVIGILAMVTMGAVGNSKKKANDARRISDLMAIKKALVLAKQDSENQSYFPQCFTAIGNGCDIWSTPAGTNPKTIPALDPKYIPSIPVDPKTGNPYHYNPLPNDSPANNCNNTSNGNSPKRCTTFTLEACIEYINIPNAVADNALCKNIAGYKYVISSD